MSDRDAPPAFFQQDGLNSVPCDTGSLMPDQPGCRTTPFRTDDLPRRNSGSGGSCSRNRRSIGSIPDHQARFGWSRPFRSRRRTGRPSGPIRGSGGICVLPAPTSAAGGAVRTRSSRTSWDRRNKIAAQYLRKCGEMRADGPNYATRHRAPGMVFVAPSGTIR